MIRIGKKIIGRITRTAKVCWPTLLIIFLYLSIFTQVVVASGSMEPTLMTGDRCMLFNVWMIYKPHRGDIIGFTMGNEIWTKRVIGLPGEEVVISDGLVYINGELLEENYLPENTYTDAGELGTYTVPEGCVFLMGDNRAHSYDGRYWEDHYMPLSRIIGKYGFTIWHNKKQDISTSTYIPDKVSDTSSEMEIADPALSTP